jgi:cytochrome P450
MLLQATHEDGTPMGDAELRDELLALVLAGHETTATALAWAMDLLLCNPQVLARVRAREAGELAAILRVLARSPLRLAVRRPQPVRATGVTLVPGRGVRLVREAA